MITPQQRIERLNGIGGSDVAIILGLSSYKTPYQLYLEKRGLVVDEPEESSFQEWGSRLEPLIRIKYAESNNVDVLAPKDDKTFSPPSERVKFTLGTITHPLHHFMRANIDGFIPSLNRILEIKCANSFMGKEWGEATTDMIPAQYLCQVAHYVSCMNAEGADIAVLIGGYDYKEFHYKRDLELEMSIIHACDKFWKCVQEHREPAPITIDDLRLKYRAVDDRKVTATPDIQMHLDTLSSTKETMKKLKEIEEKSKFIIMEYMKTAETLVDLEGRTLASWAADKNGKRSFRTKEQ
jgi:putative phage-type endonuclease